MLTRGIDLSVAANLALSGMLVALVGQYGPDMPALVYIVLGALSGAFLGLLIGLLVGWARHSAHRGHAWARSRSIAA